MWKNQTQIQKDKQPEFNMNVVLTNHLKMTPKPNTFQEFRVMIGAKPNLMAQGRTPAGTTKPGNAKTTTTVTTTANCVTSTSVTASPAMTANNIHRK